MGQAETPAVCSRGVRPGRRLAVGRVSMLLLPVVACLLSPGCASLPDTETAEQFRNSPDTRLLRAAEVERLLVGRVLVMAGTPGRRVLHESTVIIDQLRAPDSPFSRGSWTFDPAGRYCQNFLAMDTSGGYAGICYHVYQRGTETGLVARGASGRWNLIKARVEEAKP